MSRIRILGASLAALAVSTGAALAADKPLYGAWGFDSAGMDKATTAQSYEPFAQVPFTSLNVVIRTNGSSAALLGASAAIESVACVQAIRTGWVHPTINQEYPDPDCDLDYIPNTARNVPSLPLVSVPCRMTSKARLPSA